MIKNILFLAKQIYNNYVIIVSYKKINILEDKKNHQKKVKQPDVPTSISTSSPKVHKELFNDKGKNYKTHFAHKS